MRTYGSLPRGRRSLAGGLGGAPLDWLGGQERATLGVGEAAASMQPSVQHGLLLALVARAVWRLVGVHTEELCERCSARASAVSHVYVSGVGDGSTCKIIGFTF